MKFDKRFRQTIEHIQPELSDKFLNYKMLKKKLHTLSPCTPETSSADTNACTSHGMTDESNSETISAPLSKNENEFIELIMSEVQKFNDFFLEKEEELVMKEQSYRQRALEAMQTATPSALHVAAHTLAKFHGEVVLLENWALLNWSALVKVLKKHDKQTSLHLRSPMLRRLVNQPWHSTELLEQLVLRAERTFNELRDAAQSSLLRCKDGNRSVDLDVPPLKGMDGIVQASDANADCKQHMERIQKAVDMWQSLEAEESFHNPLGEMSEPEAEHAIREHHLHQQEQDHEHTRHT